MQHAARSSQLAARSTVVCVVLGSRDRRRAHGGCRHEWLLPWPAAVGVCAACLLVPERAGAAFTQAQCYPSAVAVPVDVGAKDFNTAWTDAGQYGHNQEYPWKILVNSNVSRVNWLFQNFYTEYSYDRLTLDHQSGTFTLSGNLGSGSLLLYPVLVPPNNRLRYYGAKWRSDGSVFGVQPSIPALHTAQVECIASANPTESHIALTVNERHEGLLIADGDVIYTTVTQPANTRLYVTVDALAGTPNNMDLDLYGSVSTAFPDDTNYTWRDYRANLTSDLTEAGAALDLGPTGTSPRTVYIGVRSYRGRGHFVLRANVAKTTGGARSLTICHPQASNIQNHPHWPAAKETITRTLTRFAAATHGNIYYDTVHMKYSSTNGGDKWCSSIPGCNWCMTSLAFPDFCGFQSNVPGRVRVPNIICAGGSGPGDYDDAVGLSLVLAHENAHGLLALDDEYDNNQGGSFCGHSLLNGPGNWVYRFCKPIDHCVDVQPGATIPAWADCSDQGSNWSKVSNGPYANWFATLPGLYTFSSQPWSRHHDNKLARDNIAFFYE